MANLTGQVILNRYSVHEFLGSGGMAEVYKVWDNDRNTFLAMKVLHEKYAQNNQLLEHFRREAETLAKLKHPNIVRFYGFEQDQTRSYILMDFIEGQTLKDKIKSKNGTPFGTDEISNLLSPVLVALQFAHNRGLIHCDIKPANIMVDAGGKVLLTDFGIARASYLDSRAMSSSGTPAYMAPEQIRNEAPVPETDIYALGVVLYEMLTGGIRPFNGTQAQVGGSRGERIRWEQEYLQPPSPLRWNPSLHPKLNAILDKALAKQSAQRYRSAIDFANALNSVGVTTQPTPAKVVREIESTLQTPTERRTSFQTGTQKTQRATLTAPRKKNTQATRNVGLLLVVIFFFVAVGVAFSAIFSGGGGGLAESGASSGGQISAPTQTISPVEMPVIATHTPFAQFIVHPYDQTRDADAVLIYDNQVAALTRPGRATGNFTLDAGKDGLLMLGWCVSEQSLLAGNLAHIRHEVVIDGYSIPLASFASGEGADQRGLWCKSYTGALTGLARGTHTYTYTQHFNAEINDGVDSFPAGNYVVEYTITVR